MKFFLIAIICAQVLLGNNQGFCNFETREASNFIARKILNGIEVTREDIEELRDVISIETKVSSQKSIQPQETEKLINTWKKSMVTYFKDCHNDTKLHTKAIEDFSSTLVQMKEEIPSEKMPVILEWVYKYL